MAKEEDIRFCANCLHMQDLGDVCTYCGGMQWSRPVHIRTVDVPEVPPRPASMPKTIQRVDRFERFLSGRFGTILIILGAILAFGLMVTLVVTNKTSPAPDTFIGNK